MSIDVPEDWWDAQKEHSLFRHLYYQGDKSFEGHLPGEKLTQDQRTQRECYAVLRALAPTRGSRYLDCPCGEGRHSLFLAKNAPVSVVGIDLSEHAIETATRAAGRARLDNVHFHTGDMRDIPLGKNEVDYVLNMFLSFGFFHDDADNLRVLQEYARVLRPGGKLLIYTDINPDRISEDTYRDRTERLLQDGAVLSIDEHIDTDTSRLIGKWTIDGPQGSESAKYSVRVYSHEEMYALLREAGFSRISWIPFDPLRSNGSLPREIAYIAE